MHIPRSVMERLRALGDDGQPVRDAVRKLFADQSPVGSYVSLVRLGRREMFIKSGNRGFFLAWTVTRDRGESVVSVVVVEENL